MTSWSKGLTKETNPSLMKTSETMRIRKLDNFKKWRDRMKSEGKIKSSYPALVKNENLAELIGVVLGDGHVGVFPRAECLRIVGTSTNHGFVERYSKMVERIFNKKPYVAKRKQSNATDITIYEKNISKRLGVPTGARKELALPIPNWIRRSKKFQIAYLRGLYEAEGCYAVHLPTGTHKFIFTNMNKSLISNVFELVQRLGFHPHISANKVQVSRKEEVQKLKKLLKFRFY